MISNEKCLDSISDINSYVGNLTSSYTDKSNEPNMVAASVIMFALAGLFFNLNLFSGITDTSAILDPKVRLFLSSALSLFLPVMSYLFSEAKNNHNAADQYYTNKGGSAYVADLSLRAGIILAWMLLVELLRKKVDEIRMRGYSGTIQRAGRVVWLGSLVFFNIKSTGRKVVFAILWILCATRVLQRIAFTEFGKRSYAHGKNARLISSYMAQMLEQQQEEPRATVGVAGDEVLKECNYIVMGEEMLVDIEPTADGYKLDKKASSRGYDDGGGVVRLIRENDGIVTVGKVWELDDKDKFFTSLEQIQRLKRICLSFALFKLLRRRFEHLPTLSKQEEDDSRDLLLKGLYDTNGETASSSAEAMFQVMNDEVNFLSEYYHSVVPVVLASPFFLFLNYIILNIVIAVLCVMTVIICANGDVRYAFQSIITDNYTLKSGVFKIVICLLHRVNKPEAFFSIVDLSITVLLFIIYFYEEIWEFFVFLLSNWFMVSMLYNYTSKPRWLRNTTFRGTMFWVGFSIIMWLRSKMSHPSRLEIKQFSVLNVRWPLKLPLFAAFTGLAVQKRLVPNSVKKSIMDYLVEDGREIHLDRGRSALRKNFLSDKLSWACQSDSVAEVILTWHIATSIMEVERRPQSIAAEETTFSRVAITLSKYCAYLVAFHPELLPENPEKVELVFEEMKKELKAMIGCREYYFSTQRARIQKLIDGPTTLTPSDECSKVVRDGVKLGKLLMTDAADNKWKVLADVWTELIIYLAPSSDEERVIGHEGALVQGSEFITVLWALTTHIGVSRPPTEKPPATTYHVDLEG
ncbi:uncharacterized protein LOC120712152 [Panicum virgatum]|uniref:DUF4220 domain-containing protein n=1 Tax=Panicum virgatum TaxID=38727 RepID=A0A8T0RDW7_PANVG|nr:uncharacterized protein LOC120712152 [Panicum virgatum]KAG2583295.1 hypothetical protein PVAP13_6KG137648 [Panicum virgatum]